jgi:hypothetical protein
MICSAQLLANRDAKAAAEEDSLQIVKIVMISFFTALTIEGHNRVLSLVDYVLMRFDAVRHSTAPSYPSVENLFNGC